MFSYIVYGFLYLIISFFRWIGWWRWTIEGVERLPPREQGGMILVMNHINWVDIPAVGALLPFRYRLSWLAKIEIFANPLAGWFFRNMNVIPIRRGKRDLAALEAAAEALRNGAVLLIFPEGHRSRNGILQPGRGGAIRLAMQAGVPIVPMAITGTEHGFRGTLRREPVHIKIGEPYRIEPLPDNKIPADVMERLTTAMMVKIAALLPPAQRGPYASLVEAATTAQVGLTS
ncbi:MAG: 1-acyl-sn-glycerol-3-phosphate acyltransferase [Chloroflexus sp.]